MLLCERGSVKPQLSSNLDPQTRVSILLVTLFAAFLFTSCSTPKTSSGAPPRRLVLGLDGIPFDTFQKMQNGGHFRRFQPAAPMIATFPSISDPNWTKIFALEPEPSFTKSYFDPSVKTSKGLGEENGSLLTHLSKEPRYEQILDFKVEGLGEHLSMFVWTQTTAKYWLQALQKSFFDFTGRDTYYAFIVNTDIIAHTEGETSLMQYLEMVDETLEQISAKFKRMYGQDLEIILVSDHGNAFFTPEDVPFEESLKSEGWTLSETLKNPKDFGFYVPEMLSFGAFYCLPESKPSLAQSLARVGHVEITAYEDSDHVIHVFGDHGKAEALISHPQNHFIFYKVLRGKDPLQQSRYFTKGKLAFDDYFQRSFADEFPYSAVRIWEAFNVNSQIKPHVLASAATGFVFGNKTLRIMTKLKGFASEHGSLGKEQTSGLFASTTKSFSPVRPEDVARIINSEQLKRSPKVQ